MVATTGSDSSFFTDTVPTPTAGEVSESESDSELEELLELAFRLRPFIKPLTVGFCEAAGVGSCAPASSFSSSASLSELELDADFVDELVFDVLLDFLEEFFAGVASFISTSESLILSLLSLPLLLVISFAAALACDFTFSLAFVTFFDFLAALVSSVSSLSLLLVSSTCRVSW